MKATFLTLISTFLLAGILIAQQIQFSDSKFRSSGNQKYWKNKLPRQDYWQQDVHYHIEASLNVEENMMKGTYYKLVYHNNSPHLLNQLFFHLYDNSFTPGSHYHSLVNSNHAEPVFGKNEKAGKAMQVYDLQVNGQVPAKQELDYSVLKVTLNESLKPGDSLVVTCTFKTWWSDGGSLRRRNKSFDTYGFLHVNGTHWYPTIAVFDAHSGWNVDQHLDKEYYTNFGTYDVALTFPNDYIVEATGVLLNENEVLPDSLKAKLDIKNFKSKPFGEKPSTITPRRIGEKKTWIFRAENVHNFAFTGNPTYRIGTSFWNGVKVVTLAQEPHASRWQPSAAFAAAVIRAYSETFGQYEWPKIVVADAGDGMEYPMLTLCGGIFPSHQELLAHEIGHQWFYGMLGSNETYRAWMDEGFTQYLTIEASEQLLPGQAFREYPKMTMHKYFGLYLPYLSAVRNGWDHKLNTHSSDFNGAVGQKGGYGLVYTKTGTMLHQLKYVLGDAMFSAALKHYVVKWKFCHPYPEDFRQAIIEYTQQDLNWFFDQWLETTKKLDYGIKKVREQGNKYEIELKRFEDMEMPLDLRATDVAGKTYDFHIPNRYFNNRSFTSKGLSNWYGWGAYIKPTYQFSIELDAKLQSLEIDPEGLMADMNRVNNYWKPGLFHRKLSAGFGLNTTTYPLWFYPNLKFAPRLWYNGFDGLQLGAQWAANYFDQSTFASGGIWANTGFLQMHAKAPWKSYFQLWGGEVAFAIKGLGKGQILSPTLLWDAGLFRGKLGWEKEFRKQDQNNPRYWRLKIDAVWMSRSDHGPLYLLQNDPFPAWSNIVYPMEFFDPPRRAWNNFVNAEIFRQYPISQGVGYLTFSVRVPQFGSDFNYSWAQVETKHLRNIGRTQLRFRTFARLGFGNTPYESQLRLSGAPREEWIDNQWTRARGFHPGEWGSTRWNAQHNLHVAGGLGLRGMFNNRLYGADLGRPGNQVLLNTSRSGLSTNLEYDFAKLVGLKPGKRLTWQFYTFADAALVFDKLSSTSTYDYYSFANAGLGTNVEIKTTSFMRKPIILRLDVPFWANENWGSQNNFRPRWVVGFDKTF